MDFQGKGYGVRTYTVTAEDRGHDTPCLIWHGPVNSQGYPRVYINRRRCLYHRYLCEQTHGPPPGSNYVAHHECMTILCVNPAHIVWMPLVEHIKLHRVGRSPNRGRKFKRDERGHFVKGWQSP